MRKKGGKEGKQANRLHTSGGAELKAVFSIEICFSV